MSGGLGEGRHQGVYQPTPADTHTSTGFGRFRNVEGFLK